jgi:hypothetical protein
MGLLVLTDLQQVELSVAPVDAVGNPAPLDGKPTWAVSDDTILVLQVSDDGLKAVAVTTNKLGTCQVSVTADADLGAGVTTLTGTQDVEVKASQAVGLGMAAGAPTDKAPPVTP